MKLSKAYNEYGSSMGRPGNLHTFNRDRDPSVRVRLARVSINSGGYDSGGAYWGTGDPLWKAQAETGGEDSEIIEAFFRASNREAAKEMIPDGKFYR